MPFVTAKNITPVEDVRNNNNSRKLKSVMGNVPSDLHAETSRENNATDECKSKDKCAVSENGFDDEQKDNVGNGGLEKCEKSESDKNVNGINGDRRVNGLKKSKTTASVQENNKLETKRGSLKDDSTKNPVTRKPSLKYSNIGSIISKFTNQLNNTSVANKPIRKEKTVEINSKFVQKNESFKSSVVEKQNSVKLAEKKNDKNEEIEIKKTEEISDNEKSKEKLESIKTVEQNEKCKNSNTTELLPQEETKKSELIKNDEVKENKNGLPLTTKEINNTKEVNDNKICISKPVTPDIKNKETDVIKNTSAKLTSKQKLKKSDNVTSVQKTTISNEANNCSDKSNKIGTKKENSLTSSVDSVSTSITNCNVQNLESGTLPKTKDVVNNNIDNIRGSEINKQKEVKTSVANGVEKKSLNIKLPIKHTLNGMVVKENGNNFKTPQIAIKPITNGITLNCKNDSTKTDNKIETGKTDNDVKIFINNNIKLPDQSSEVGIKTECLVNGGVKDESHLKINPEKNLVQDVNKKINTNDVATSVTKITKVKNVTNDSNNVSTSSKFVNNFQNTLKQNLSVDEDKLKNDASNTETEINKDINSNEKEVKNSENTVNEINNNTIFLNKKSVTTVVKPKTRVVKKVGAVKESEVSNEKTNSPEKVVQQIKIQTKEKSDEKELNLKTVSEETLQKDNECVNKHENKESSSKNNDINKRVTSTSKILINDKMKIDDIQNKTKNSTQQKVETLKSLSLSKIEDKQLKENKVDSVKSEENEIIVKNDDMKKCSKTDKKPPRSSKPKKTPNALLKLDSGIISPTLQKILTRMNEENGVDLNKESAFKLLKSTSTSSVSSTETVTSSNYESIASTSSYYDTANSDLANKHLPPLPTRKIMIKHSNGQHSLNLPSTMQKGNTFSNLIMSSSPSRSRPSSVQSYPQRNVFVSRSPSPVSISSRSGNSYSGLNLRSRSISPISRSDRSPTPRRIFPQSPARAELDEIMAKEQSPVVFDANLSFLLGCKSQIRQNIKTVAAHMDSTTASNYLSTKISDFLKRTDHVMDEWKYLGHRGDDEDDYPKSAEERRILGKSKSAANIAIKGYTMFSNTRALSLGRSGSLGRISRASSIATADLMSDDTFSEFDELTEMTADLAEEHSTATLATEKLDAETSERVRLEREISELQSRNRSLQQSSERMEMELLYARSDMSSVVSADDDEDADAEVYKRKYERVTKELEFMKRRLQQQHEDDLEQLVELKKQLEKKLADAYEDVEEQRQVVSQWKRKVQKQTTEMNDVRLLLEEQNARNNLLEKKQRKFDSEIQILHDELRQEKQARERVSREKELVMAEKYTLENNLADIRLELELKDERLNTLQQEINDLTFEGKSEDELALLRKQKQDCERRLHDQEEELDDLAGQVQMLEQAKVRLEMLIEQQRKESRREAQQRDEELEEVRANTQKKVKALEAQLENEHEERTLLLREKHSLERRLASISEAGRSEREGEEAQLQRLKRDLRRTKALLRDAQMMLEKTKADSPSKILIRQLRNQLEDLELARAAAVKTKQNIESELSDVQSQLEEAHRQKSEAEQKSNQAIRERSDLQSQLEENEEELAEVMKKYRATVQQLSVDQLALQEQMAMVSSLETERSSLKEQLNELNLKLESLESVSDPTSIAQVKRLELRIRELESKLEFEQTTHARLETQISRLKEAVEKLQSDLVLARGREQLAQDNVRKLQRSLRELRDEHTSLSSKESESQRTRKELEKKLESAEAETSAAKSDLRLALQRISDLQAAMQGELEDSSSEHSDSEQDSISSDESIGTFLDNHKLGTVKPNRPMLELDTSPR